MTFLMTFAFFALCMAGMAVGLIFSNRELQGSCGGAADLEEHGHDIECGACVKKSNDVCPSDDPLVRIAQLGHPNPSHHR